MIRVTHDAIEYNLETVLEFKPGTPDFIRREVRDLIEIGLNDSEAIYDGEYIEIERFADLKTNAGNTKDALNDLVNELDRIIETCGVKTAAKFETWLTDLTVVIENIET